MKLSLMLLIGLIVVSCATTDITSYVDPEFQKTKFSRIMVMVPFTDIDMRKEAESYFVDKLASRSVTAFSSVNLIPPTRELNAETLSVAVTSNNLDSILLVTQTDSSTAVSYIPSQTQTTGMATISNNTMIYSAQSSQYGGYYVYKPRLNHNAKLIDVRTGKCAWISSSKTRGNAYAKSDIMLYSLAEETVAALAVDGLLPQ